MKVNSLLGRSAAKSRLGVAILASTALAASACNDTENACHDSNGVRVCGEIGTALFTVDMASTPIEWPPVAVQEGGLIVARGDQLLRISKSGVVTPMGNAGQDLTVPSSDESGNLYLIGGGSAGSQVRALNGQSLGDARWQQNLSGAPVGTPATIGEKTVYAATTDWTSQSTLYALNRSDGKVLFTRVGASPAAVLPDGSIRYLSGNAGSENVFNTENATTKVFKSLVAEDASGKVLWTLPASQGFIDFAPGPKGDTFAVTGGDHVLQRVSAEGKIKWTFTPDCNNCTVAAAPTVTRDTVYFPVWERKVEPIDPLYAIDAETGKKAWVYNGFATTKTSYSGSKLLTPGGSADTPVDKFKTQHHPAGRPVVAQDGTLYVATDGALSALDKNGQVVGLAIYDASAGEVSLATGFMAQPATWINPGVRPSPVLAPDGTLYVWDGAQLRAFDAGKPAIDSAWVAPFGSPRNDGRIPR
ncbi:MAG: hypothetical protein EXR77_00290 [Myxococcales bacterium]|nr:hypothetical protein [Myxococcales bacterium]